MKPSPLLLAVLTIPFLGVACAEATPEPRAGGGPVATVVAERAEPAPEPAAGAPSDDGDPKCTVKCEGVQIATVKGNSFAISDADSHTTAEVANATGVLNDHNDDFMRCYKPRVRATPGLQGTVTFDIRIGPDGHVVGIVPHGGERLATVPQCMMKVIEGLEFEPPHGGGTLDIRAPFTLSLETADESV